MALTKVTNDLQDALAASQPTITSTGTLTDFTSTGIDDNATSTAITIDASENVGIGTGSPSSYGKFAIRGSETIATFGETSAHFSDAATGSMYITHASNNISLKTDGDLGLFANNADSVIISTTATERMRIDSSGRVTMPSQPSFDVFSDGTPGQIAAGVYTWTNENFDTGNNFSSNKFTAPVAGKYYFTVTQQLYGMTSAGVGILFRKNGSNYGPYTYNNNPTSTYHNSVTVNRIISLAANDYVDVYRAETTRGMQSTFSGFLIG